MSKNSNIILNGIAVALLTTGIISCGVDFQGAVDILPGLSSGDGAGISDSDIDGVDADAVRAFVTSATYNGDLVAAGGDPDPQIAADNLCTNAAQAQGLVRDYKAIISVTGSDAATRLAPMNSKEVYVVSNTMGTPFLVVSQGSDLWNALAVDLVHQINYDETGTQLLGNVWTGTNDDGTLAAASNCTDYTSSAAQLARVGRTNRTDEQWISAVATIKFCSNLNHIYCVGLPSGEWGF